MNNHNLWLAAVLCMALPFGRPFHAADNSGVTVFMGAKSDVGWGITATQDGGYLVVGGTDSVGAGNEDGLVLKLDAQSHIMWTLVLGGPLDDEFEEAVQTPDGGYAVCGGSYSFNHVGSSGYLTPWLVRLDATGHVVWQKYYVRAVAAMVWRIVETQDGGFALCGVSWTATDTGTQAQHPYLLRTDAAGEIEWQVTLGPDIGRFQGMCELPDEGFAIAGQAFDMARMKIYTSLLRTSARGELVWWKGFEVPNEYDSEESPADVIPTPDGGLLFGGGNPGQVRRLDQDGNTIWSQRADIVVQYGDRATIHSLFPIEEGGYLAAGELFHLGMYSSDDYGGSLLLRLEEDGTIRWARGYVANARDPSSTQACRLKDGGVAFVGAIPAPTDWARTALVRVGVDGDLTDPCMVIRDIQDLWTIEPSPELSDVPSVIDAECASFVPTPQASAAALDSADTLCPVVRQVRILKNPFRLDVKGFNLAPGELVYVDGVQAPQIRYVSGNELIGKGGDALKRMVPKGQPVCIQAGVLAEPPYTSECFTFTR